MPKKSPFLSFFQSFYCPNVYIYLSKCGFFGQQKSYKKKALFDNAGLLRRRTKEKEQYLKSIIHYYGNSRTIKITLFLKISTPAKIMCGHFPLLCVNLLHE